MLENHLKWQIIFISFFINLNTQAQQKAESKFIDWITQIEQQYEVSFSYNHSLFENLLIDKKEGLSTLQENLDYIAQQASVKFNNIEDESYLIVPIRQKVQFQVIDAETNEFIISLHVQVNQQPEFYLLPNDENFEIDKLYLTDSVKITSRFYQSIFLTASELFLIKKPLTILSDTIYLNDVIIEGYLTSGIDSKLSDHSINVDMKDLGVLAGETDGDILTLLKAIPGVNTPDGKPGSLNFRGSTFDHTLIYFDDIPIYHSGHFFGTISPYNSSVVEKIKIQRGTLPAKWGGRVGGLIDIQTDSEIADSTTYGLMINTVYAGANVNVPLIKDKLSIALSARSNYPFDVLSPKLEAFSDLNFQGSKIDPFVIGNQNVLDKFHVRFKDINGKVNYRLNENHKTTFSFMNITNDFEYNFNSPNRDLIEVQTSELDNWGFTVKWDGQLTEKLNASAGITQSELKILENNTEIEAGNFKLIEELKHSIQDVRLNTSLEYQINKKSSIEFGYNFTDQKVISDEKNDGSKPGKDKNNSAQTHSIYVSSQHNLSDRLITNIGIHTDYYSKLSKSYFDPRFSISYKVTDFVFMKASAGRSHQFITQLFNTDFNDFRLQNQVRELADDQNPVLVGNQAMIGAIIDYSGWVIDLELYVKNTDGITQQLAPGNNQNGTLKSKGLDLFVKRKWTKFESWISYSLSKTETEFEGIISNALIDQRHIVNTTLVLHQHRWDGAISWSYSSGLPVIIPELDPNHPNSDGQTTLDIPYAANFPAQHQLDLSITYKFWKVTNQWRGVIGLSLLNVYDRKNTINIFQNNPRVEQPFRVAVGFAPNVNLRLRF